MPKMILIGTAYPFRGGLAAFNERLACEFQNNGWEVEIWTFTVQYPSFLFPGTSQFAEGPAPEGLKIIRKIHSANPLNWIKVGRQLRKIKPELVITKFWIPFMGPCLGTILKMIKGNGYSKIVCIVDNLFPHEKRIGDKMLIKYFIGAPKYFICMSEKVSKDLGQFIDSNRFKLLDHPMFDHFGEIIDKAEARKYLKLQADQKIILFFGFIRKYKGLQLLLESIVKVKETLKDFNLVIAGEFYEDSEPYLKFIRDNQLSDVVTLRTHFIPDSEVKYYLSAADVLVQPYINATQSGVTPLAYHFEVPMIVTDVGSLARLVPDKKVGLVCQPDVKSLSHAITVIFEYDLSEFKRNIIEEKKKLGWKHFLDEIVNI